jgi:hypothetical protein
MLRRRAVVPVLSLLLAACGTRLATPARHAVPSSPHGEASTSPSDPGRTSRADSSPGLGALPPDLADFPVPPAARPLPVPDGSDLIGTWAIEPGSGAYRFYQEALPAAGFSITGLAPGGSVAIIRFEDVAGVAWQIDIHGDLDSAVVELGPERP